MTLNFALQWIIFSFHSINFRMVVFKNICFKSSVFNIFFKLYGVLRYMGYVQVQYRWNQIWKNVLITSQRDSFFLCRTSRKITFLVRSQGFFFCSLFNRNWLLAQGLAHGHWSILDLYYCNISFTEWPFLPAVCSHSTLRE